jgi:hypothetical protein
MPAPLIVFGAISAAPGVITALKNIFDDAHDKLNEQLNQVLTQLQELRHDIVTATGQILEAIDGIRRQINENVALDNMTLADVALFSDLAIPPPNEREALDHSFQAADRLFQQRTDNDIVFAGPFMYVVNIRLAVLKDFDPNYFCNQQFQKEFRRYIDHLSDWIAQVNDLIARSNTILEAEEIEDLNSKGIIGSPLEASYLHNGAIVQTFKGGRNDLSEETIRHLNQAANAARSEGIEADRQHSGVVEWEKTAAAWAQAFRTTLRQALVNQVLNRATLASDVNPDGFLIDGRLLPANLDFRSTLIELLISHEFRDLAQKSIDAFINGSDDRLGKFRYRRLFNRDATSHQVDLLHRIAAEYGYSAFVAALLHSKEYEERYGRGLPGGGQSIVPALSSQEESWPELVTRKQVEALCASRLPQSQHRELMAVLSDAGAGISCCRYHGSNLPMHRPGCSA